MFKYVILTSFLWSIGLCGQNTNSVLRTIEVTGTTELTLEPDEIHFTITIEEYWEEEFQGKKWEEYKTKVEIENIESDLIQELSKLGIGLDKITLNQTGNYWRQRGKDFLINKNLDIKLESFEKANEIANTISTRGIKNMFVTRLDKEGLEEDKLKAKSMALTAARRKAQVILSAIGRKPGDALSIVEVDKNIGTIRRDPGVMRGASAMMADTAEPSIRYENFRKIKIRAEVRVIFEIK